jgi:hypothetical protein
MVFNFEYVEDFADDVVDEVADGLWSMIISG